MLALRIPSSQSALLMLNRILRNAATLTGAFVIIAVLSKHAPAAESPQSPKQLLQMWGPVEREVKSEFSHIRVRRKGTVRTLLFVRDSGFEIGETQVNMRRPEALLIPYTQALFASYLIQPEQKRVLIVGLGGGAMVHFLKHHEPELQIDVVEIDPAVVRIADELFDIRTEDNVNIMTKDGFEYFASTEHRYDAIYLDAFLKPSTDTDDTGVSLRMKTIDFYGQIASRLQPEGVVAFNINSHAALDEDVRTIKSAYKQAYVFDVARSENVVVITSNSGNRFANRDLSKQARLLDRRFKSNFSFARFVPLLRDR